MLPGIAYYLSRWYRRSELAFRLSLYIVMAPLAGAFGGLLASGILTLDSVGSLQTWRMIFVIEGIITCGLALISFVTLTDRPATARWLSAEERELAIARVKSERVGATEVLDKMDTKKLLAGIFNPVTLGTSMIFLLNNITVQGLAFFLPTIVRVSFTIRLVIKNLFENAELTIIQDDLSIRHPHRHLPTTPHRPTLRRWRLLHGPLPFPLLALRSTPNLLHRLRPPHHDRIHHVPRLARPPNPLRRNLPHHGRRLRLRSPVQRASIRQRPDGHGARFGHRHKCHVRQHWRFDLNLGFPALRRTGLSDWQWFEPRHELDDSHLEYPHAVLHEVEQLEERQEEPRG